MLASVYCIIFSCWLMLFTNPSKSFSFMRQFRLQMDSYLPIVSLCFLSSSYLSKCISQAMKFSCLANCSTLKSIAFCRSTIFYLNLSIFSVITLRWSSCFLCCLKTLVNFCSSIVSLSSIEMLLTRSLPCNYAFLFRSRFYFLTCLIRDRKLSDYLLS